MIGCEKLCGRCSGECQWITGALRWYSVEPDDTLAKAREYLEANNVRAGMELLRWIERLADPSALADLLARAMRIGRNVNAFVNMIHDEGPAFCCIALEGKVWITYRKRGDRTRFQVGLDMPQARAALSRILALPLDCGAEKALAALEST